MTQAEKLHQLKKALAHWKGEATRHRVALDSARRQWWADQDKARGNPAYDDITMARRYDYLYNDSIESAQVSLERADSEIRRIETEIAALS